MIAADPPLYVSRRLWRNFWQDYRVYPSGIELKTWLGKITIAADELLEVDVRQPTAIGDVGRGKSLAYALPLKLDLVDSYAHVAIRRKSGRMKYVRFTPDDPQAFADACRAIMK